MEEVVGKKDLMEGWRKGVMPLMFQEKMRKVFVDWPEGAVSAVLRRLGGGGLSSRSIESILFAHEAFGMWCCVKRSSEPHN